MMWLLRVFLLAFIIFLVYSAFKYVLHPKRKLELAHEQKRFFFLDDDRNVRKNFLLTYKGVMFEGEKYLGTTDETFEVVSIFIWPHRTSELNGLSKADFQTIENEIGVSYPHARIDWKSPIHEFLKK